MAYHCDICSKNRPYKHYQSHKHGQKKFKVGAFSKCKGLFCKRCKQYKKEVLLEELKKANEAKYIAPSRMTWMCDICGEDRQERQKITHREKCKAGLLNKRKRLHH